MFGLFKWFKIVMITVLLTQHGFTVAKPMNCEEHHNGSSDTHIMQPSKDIHHQTKDSNSHHHAENSQDAKHNHADEECEKCKAGDCLCCEGGFCASFHLNAYLVQVEEESSNNSNLDLIIQRIPPPASGIHLLPYRPPIIG
ncbi:MULTISPECIES: hypothetical protein [Pseudoalteromonas]|uniref:hypothetical protein n=1 Tax=Pseudoalteromonas TaxID=53246 RepID=UPI0023586322|nr:MULTISPECIES: hypothetical protein [unclassified Pseudoalteromonas]MDC9503131.1 hypothetical protein [Pseudoalteromonas sp. Angola-18]MDC9510800.1 hypothetical protein [Pseudoalteromonas sp. Angola-4]